MLNLGVNVDHVATVREARKITYPSPLEAALICEEAGAWGITAHLREDRRHIQDRDMVELKAKVKRLNMEMGATEEMLRIACELKPHSSCLVPEKRQELTTEGGLEVVANLDWITESTRRLQAAGIVVSLFIDPDEGQIKAAAQTGCEYIELHTGAFANHTGEAQAAELNRLIKAAELATSLGIKVNAGHGIDYKNISGILEIPHLHELNIGHSIIGRAVIVGIRQAVSEMLDLMREYPC
ncbi:pyridoxine 5'-phosphate synthase [Lentisphaerota bacterium ZTH]|nr:pyridoxine 5'-phosphate synthase [Lentisphaerota bacterium]WET06247.1 pyridoxine 5'-phosphate synthase [Lentisphaerota bacterium ZTH]